ncbi:hypothetical protein vseg_009651 [Gypsophila vaccaria]
MDEEKTLIEILEEGDPLDIVKFINFVRAPESGAIATFSGTTRDTFNGNTVLELRYEAYVPMAIRCIKTICSAAREIWDLNLIAVAHKLGRVPVGETSVFIAISSVHRVDALDACKYLIDELKATVPIWKKEVYANGEVWKENSEFLDRKSELGKTSHGKKGCCGSKSRIIDETVEETKEAKSGKKSCCGSKVKVDDEIARMTSEAERQ